MMRCEPPPTVIVFDLGGVLYDFQGARLIVQSSRRPLALEEVRESWVPLVRRFETGACSELEFAASVVLTYDLGLDTAAFLAAFRSAAVGFYDGALDLVGQLRKRHTVLSLSNTNAVQWPVVLGGLGAEDPFHAHYPSHRSGFHKPDLRAFQAIAHDYDPTSRFYFFDDRAENVSAAAALGWHARHVRGVAEARGACVNLGLLDL
jgi:putative hydrolase of the HAD superfamily